MGAIFFPGKIQTTNGQIETPVIECLNASASIPPFPISENANYGYYLSFSVDQSDITPNVTYVPKTPLTISVEGVIQEPWYSIITTHDGNYHNIFTLSNGYSCEAKYERINSRLGSLYIIFKDNHGTIINTGNQEYFAGSIKPDGTIENPLSIGLVIVQDETTGKIFGATYNAIVYSTRFIIHYGNLINGTNRSNEGFFDGSIVPNYVWEPVPYLAGNDNQFYLELSQIDESIIGDGATPTYSEDSTKFILTNASNFNRLLANVPNNAETVIAYCGDHYMTVTRQYDPPALIRFKLKFYFGPDMLVYETDEIVINDPPINNPRYLSFIIDKENEVAALDTIQHLESIERYNYNEEGLPDAADMLDLYIWLSGNGEEHPENDPYATGSTDDGGEPGNPRTQDHITDTPSPTISGLNLGIVTLYKPDAYDLQRISQFLWSDNVLDNFKKYFNNFADNILALYVLPFSPDNLPTKAFTVGKLTSEDPVLQDVPYCTTRFYDIDMGSVQINGRWGSYLDYAPYTRIEIYLPYCGLHSLDIDEIMSPAKQSGVLPADQGCTLSLKYRLDILTGVIVAKISVNDELRYQFNGKVGINIPLTGQTYSNLLGAIIGAAGSAAVTVASGGMTAPLAVGAIASAAGTVMAQKPNVESIGNISADASMLATKIPYIRLTSPNKPLLEDQQNFTGFPSYKSGTLSEFSGYTEVLEAHVEGIACTEEERSEILTLLKAGVIL